MLCFQNIVSFTHEKHKLLLKHNIFVLYILENLFVGEAAQYFSPWF